MTERERPTDASLRDAHRMLRDFREGRFAPGSAMTSGQQALVRQLADDLAVDGDRDDASALVLPVSRADKFWNRESMATIIEFQDALAAASRDTAEAVRTAFLARCPSAWYREIVDDACACF